MKKAQITVSYDEEKLSAITMYLEEKRRERGERARESNRRHIQQKRTRRGARIHQQAQRRLCSQDEEKQACFLFCSGREQTGGRMMKLSKIEQETIILFNEGEAGAEVYTHNKSLKRRLENAAKKNPTLYRLKDKTHTAAYPIPSPRNILKSYSVMKRAKSNSNIAKRNWKD